MKNMQLDKVVKQYIMDAICTDGYDYPVAAPSEKMLLQFLYDTFRSEYGWNIARVGEHKAFTEWMQGLPSSFNIDFENYKILELAYKWGSISPDLKGRAKERREDLILANWFNFITVKTFQLFKKYKIN